MSDTPVSGPSAAPSGGRTPAPAADRLYWRLPRPVRRPAASLTGAAKMAWRRARGLAGDRRLPVCVLEGGTPDGRQAVVLVAGRPAGAQGLANRLDEPVLRGRPGVRGGFQWLRVPPEALPQAADILVIEGDRLSAPRDPGEAAWLSPAALTLVSPVQDGTTLPTPGNESLKSDLRAARRLGLQCRSVEDPAAVAVFHDTLYLPHLRRRHGGAALPSNRSWLCRQVDGAGSLLEARAGGKTFGAMLVVRRGRLCLPLAIGFRPDLSRGDFAGVTAALYRGALEWAARHGCRQADFGRNVSFLNDGLVRYKHKWGMRAVPGLPPPPVRAVRLLRDTPGAWSWLEAHPTCRRSGRGLEALVFAGDAAPLDAERLAASLQPWLLEGLAGATLVCRAGATPGAAAEAAARLGVPVRVETAQRAPDAHSSCQPARGGTECCP